MAHKNCGSILVLSAVVILSLSNDSSATCSTRPTLKLYSGYSSYGQGHLQEAVKACQSLLNQKGNYGLTVDGYFGSNTDSAVRKYQGSRGLVVDGIVGSQTWASLCGSTTTGSTSSLQNPYGEMSKGSVVKWNPIMQFVVQKLNEKFPSMFSCSTYIGSSSSDHPGNGADCFPGRAGVAASGQDLTDGNAARDWLKANAVQLKVCYVIWQNYIWHRLGGTSYQGKSGVTYGHYDHIHISVDSPNNSC